MSDCQIVITKLPKKCTECPFCKMPWNKNLDLVSAHDQCALGSSKDVCKKRFFALEDNIHVHLKKEVPNRKNYKYDNLDPVEKMELEYAHNLKKEFNEWATKYKQGVATIEEGSAIKKKYFRALATLKEKRLLNLYLRLNSQRDFTELPGVFTDV